jgi:phosphoglucomutase
MTNPLAGQKAPVSMLADIPSLIAAYYSLHPEPSEPLQRVSFGTSGHRGSALTKSFNEDHVLAIAQAVCDYRKAHKIEGPLFMGKDTHALSAPAQITAIEVLAANGVHTFIAEKNGYTPTPLISFAILEHNRSHRDGVADGIVITPSHNPPEDGGFKYNPPNGGPADTHVTGWIEKRANVLLEEGLKDVKRMGYEAAMATPFVREEDLITPYVAKLPEIVDLEAIREAKLKIGVDPLGGASIAVYQKIEQMHRLGLDIVNTRVDPTFSFMTLDHDGKIRMDCSSPYAMASLIDLKNDFDIAFGNDTDSDRHGIVTKSEGLMNPNHYLSCAIWYLFRHRSAWKKDLKVGKTLVSSAMIDRVCASLGKEVYEVPVGFKWFSEGLFDGELGFGGEESAGAAYLRKNAEVWTTDKDGIIMTLLSAEILAKMKEDPSQIYRKLEAQFGTSYYQRVDKEATPAQKAKIKSLSPEDIHSDTLAGEKIEQIYTKAPGNGAPIGGLKIVTAHGWIAVRPSGTEDIYKIYAESFLSKAHLQQLTDEAEGIVSQILG